MKIVIITLLLTLMLPTVAVAYDFEVDGIYYSIKNGDATVTYQQYVDFFYQSDYSDNVTIPAAVTYNGTTYSVTSIGDHAFQGCTGLTSITIPESVTSIGDNAYHGCSGLTSVSIPNSVTTIGNYAFCGCTGLTIITIPEFITNIGTRAFSGCTALKTLFYYALTLRR